MRYIKAILSTTHIDSHNQRMTITALESAVKQISTSYIPVGIEHDPRIPPTGRIISAHIEPMEDGEHALVGVIEVFEAGDKIAYKDDRAGIPIRTRNTGCLQIEYDRTFNSPEDQQLISEMGIILNTESVEELKKSVDPISVLVLAGTFLIGAIASGFLEAIGTEGYEAIKSRIKKLLNNRKDNGQERLFVFKATIEKHGQNIEIQTVLSNPTDEDIDYFLENGSKEIDRLVDLALASDNKLRRVVFEYSEGNFSIKFGVRADAVPLFPVEDVKTRTND